MSASSAQPGCDAFLAPHQRVAQFIDSRINFERLPIEQYDLHDFKLERMRELLARLGDPQCALPAVHIAGTKGKGSTAAMTAAMLSAAGHRVGLFTSPHLDSIAERMTVDGQQPTDEQLCELMDLVPPAIRDMDGLGPTMRPTFFECITAIAWMHFLRCRVEIVVLEVGLGGRLDATNVCAPLATVITSISRDHERLLGGTLSRIASEKAGIIKPGVPVFSGVTQSEPRDVIRNSADKNKAPLFEIGRDLHWSSVGAKRPSPDDVCDPVQAGPSPLRIATRSPWGEHCVRVPLPGSHQARNTLLAISVCDLLAKDRFTVDAAAIERGLAGMHWPLRIEVLRRRPLVIVDAAHNDGSVDCLIETLATVISGRRLLIFGTSKDKDVAGMLRQLNHHFDDVILTQYVGNPRGVPVEVLRSIAANCLSIPFQTAATPREAWQLAHQRARTDDLICATGSFFLAAEMRAVILADGKDKASPRVESAFAD